LSQKLNVKTAYHTIELCDTPIIFHDVGLQRSSFYLSRSIRAKKIYTHRVRIMHWNNKYAA